jgi:crotonobetainyl-CoA:carnitine CoA-transferase CaiB-like acyl-CoA transferase
MCCARLREERAMDLKRTFSGVRVIELAQYVFVPGGSVMLADHGAEVIKVEAPGTGDPYRSLRIGDGREVGQTNLAMEQNNRGKKSIALDLKSESGREALLRLVETADVFLTSLRPRALRSLRLDVADLRARNPKLIYARGNGLGFRGAEADKPGFDASSF